MGHPTIFVDRAYNGNKTTGAKIRGAGDWNSSSMTVDFTISTPSKGQSKDKG